MRLRRIRTAVAAQLNKPLFLASSILAIAIHVLALYWMVGRDSSLTTPPLKRPIAVRTVKEIPAPRPKPIPTNTSTASTPRKQLPPKKKSAPATPKRSVTNTLDEIEKSFNALSAPAAPKARPIPLPPKLHLDAPPPQETASYGERLIDTLQEQLELPEFGEVKTRIVLTAPGTIHQVEILEAKSEKNAEWLKNRLLLLEAPCFNEYGICDAAIEFTVTFRNVEHP